MIQNIIALSIVFLAVTYVLFSACKKLRKKKVVNKCDGCQGCSLAQITRKQC